MTKEKWLYVLLGVLFVTYVIVEHYKPKPIDWTVTYSQNDKNPYGGYILYDRLEDMFSNRSLSNQTLYELMDADSKGQLLLLANKFRPSSADIDALFQLLGQGRSIFISAHQFSANFLDTLGLELHVFSIPTVHDTVPIAFNGKRFYYPNDFISSWFEPNLSDEWTGYGFSQNKPVLIEKQFGEGKLILSSTPLIFTNYGLLFSEGYKYASGALRLLPYDAVTYSNFYHFGRSEPATPLRYLLSQPPLKWAMYLTLLVLLTYLIIGSRRTQRAVPVLDPVKNTTVAFIRVIGALYYREGNHKNAALKLIKHFLQRLSDSYYIRTFDETAYRVLAAKSGVPEDAVVQTFDLIHSIKQADKISEERLKQLYDQINLFKLS